MLVLVRRQGKRMHIGDDVIVHVAKVRGGRVELAFEAPGDVVIAREEVAEQNRRPLRVDV